LNLFQLLFLELEALVELLLELPRLLSFLLLLFVVAVLYYDVLHLTYFVLRDHLLAEASDLISRHKIRDFWLSCILTCTAHLTGDSIDGLKSFSGAKAG
jgi:hypothetical protein